MGRRKPLRRACSVCSVKNILSPRRSFFRKNHFQTLHTLQGRESSLCGHLETVCPLHEYTLRCAVCPVAGMPYSWIQRPCSVLYVPPSWMPGNAIGSHQKPQERSLWITCVAQVMLLGTVATQNGCKCETGGQSPPVSVSPIHSSTYSRKTAFDVFPTLEQYSLNFSAWSFFTRHARLAIFSR